MQIKEMLTWFELNLNFCDFIAKSCDNDTSRSPHSCERINNCN